MNKDHNTAGWTRLARLLNNETVHRAMKKIDRLQEEETRRHHDRKLWLNKMRNEIRARCSHDLVISEYVGYSRDRCLDCGMIFD